MNICHDIPLLQKFTLIYWPEYLYFLTGKSGKSKENHVKSISGLINFYGNKGEYSCKQTRNSTSLKSKSGASYTTNQNVASCFWMVSRNICLFQHTAAKPAEFFFSAAQPGLPGDGQNLVWVAW